MIKEEVKNSKEPQKLEKEMGWMVGIVGVNSGRETVEHVELMGMTDMTGIISYMSHKCEKGVSVWK